MKTQNKNIKLLWLTAILFICYFATGCVIHKDYGYTWDEETSHTNGVVAYKYVGKIFAPASIKNDASMDSVPEFKDWKDCDYGVVFELPAVILEKKLNLTDTRDIYIFRHLPKKA